MSDGIRDSWTWTNATDYWKNKFYDMVENEKKLLRKIKRLEAKLKNKKKK